MSIVKQYSSEAIILRYSLWLSRIIDLLTHSLGSFAELRLKDACFDIKEGRPP